MKKILKNILITIMVIGTIVLIVYRLSIGRFSRLLTDLAIFPVLLIPVVVNKIVKLNDFDNLVIYLFIFIADFLGCIVNTFKYVTWFDSFAHFISGVFFFYVAYRILEIYNFKNKNIWFNILFCLGIVFATAVIWEIGEFSVDQLFGQNLQHATDTGVVDTMEDMICCTIGGILSATYYYVQENLLKHVTKRKKYNTMYM